MNKKKIEETLSDVGKKLRKVAWLVGKSSASSWAFWHFTHFVTFECWRLGGNPCRTFTSWLPNAGEKKNLLPINWGQIIRIQGSPKRAKRTGLNLQIHQKHSPGNWTVVIERQTGQTLHTATGNKCAQTQLYTSSVSCRKIYKCRFWKASACQWQLALNIIVILIRTQTAIKLKHSDNNNESQTRGKYEFKDQDSQENIHILTVELQKVSQS